MKIERKYLILEIQSLLKDEFVARVDIKEESVVIKFVNGQRFEITVKEL